jgi:hypothetical protein
MPMDLEVPHSTPQCAPDDPTKSHRDAPAGERVRMQGMDAHRRPWRVLCLESDEGGGGAALILAVGARQGRGGASGGMIGKRVLGEGRD